MGDVAGRLGLKLSDTDAFLRALGLGGADLPRGLGRSVDMTTDLTLTSDRRLSLRGLDADLGGNTVSGAADILLNGTPQINAQFSAGALDLTGVTQGESAGAASGEGVGTGVAVVITRTSSIGPIVEMPFSCNLLPAARISRGPSSFSRRRPFPPT